MSFVVSSLFSDLTIVLKLHFLTGICKHEEGEKRKVVKEIETLQQQ